MGNFSWCTSDTRKSIPCVLDAYEGAPSVVYLLNPFGTPYKEADYEGYGVFGGRDVFELVAEWNKPFLSSANIKKPDMSRRSQSSEKEEYCRAALDSYNAKCLRLSDFVSGKSDEYMSNIYGPSWKREIGIDISCYDKEHVKLRYPIKIVEKPCSYNKAGISPQCPFQGCSYEGVFTEQHNSRVERAFNNLLNAEREYADEKADLLCDFFWDQKMEDCIVAQTYPHLVVKDEEGNRWKDGEIYEFVLNECLAFEEDGRLSDGLGAAEPYAETLKAHALSYGVKPVLIVRSIDEKIAAAESMKAPTASAKTPANSKEL